MDWHSLQSQHDKIGHVGMHYVFQWDVAGLLANLIMWAESISIIISYDGDDYFFLPQVFSPNFGKNTF